MAINLRQVRRARWEKQFEVKDFKVFTSPDVAGLALVHERGKVRYRVNGRDVDSLVLAVRRLNERRNHKHQPGTVEALREGRLDAPRNHTGPKKGES